MIPISISGKARVGSPCSIVRRLPGIGSMTGAGGTVTPLDILPHDQNSQRFSAPSGAYRDRRHPLAPKSFSTTSGHCRHSAASNSRRSTPSWDTSTKARWSPPTSPAMDTVRHRLKRCAVLSRTSRKPRRSRRAASVKPDGNCTGMITRLDIVAADDQYRMPAPPASR